MLSNLENGKEEMPRESLPEQKPDSNEVFQEINKDEFELQGIENELVKKYQPKFLDEGGEHIVYEIPDHPDIVVKVATESLKRIIDWNVDHGHPMDFFSSELKSSANEDLRKDVERYQQLKKYFGSDHVLNQRKFLVKIPVTEGILNRLYDGKTPVTGNEAWGTVMVQKRAEELNNPEHLIITTGYSEQAV